MKKTRPVRRALLIISLALSGGLNLVLSLSSPALSGSIILQTVNLLNSGMDIELLRPVLSGLVAGGSISALSRPVQIGMIVYGALALYLAAFLAMNPPGSLGRLIRGKYWSRFYWSPLALRRKEALLARRRADQRSKGKAVRSR